MPIIRVFHSSEDAAAAVAALTGAGFKPSHIHVIPPAHAASLGAVLRRIGGSTTDADRYAGQLSAGGTLVAIDAPFGTTVQAERILRSVNPTGAADETALYPYGVYGDGNGPIFTNVAAVRAASEALPASFSAVRSQSEGKPSGLSGVRKASEALPGSFASVRAAAGKAATLPGATISGNDTPRSLSGVRAQSRKPFSRSLPSDSAAPFSALFHLPVLIRD
jgi:hypothetical protein